MTSDPPARRALFVHAHPDDESITTGATMAYYAARGVQVTLVTCTLGEQGEILVPEYAGLEAAQADQLGGLRIGELASAMRALGVRDHRFLGGAGRFRDSGMLGSPSASHPRAFCRADRDPRVFDAAVAALVEVIRQVRPQVVVTYDDAGDYGHPDHVMAHRVTTAALARAQDPAHGPDEPWSVAKVYWTATSHDDLRQDASLVRSRDLPFVPLPDEPPYGVDDALITTSVDASAHLRAKLAALGAHRTQILLDPPFYALSNRIGRQARGVEHYRLARGVRGPDSGGAGREADLFAGLELEAAPR